MTIFERLSDLDELTLRCRTERAKEYIYEAITCYRSGAYKACIVNTWIAVVFDLIDKIRELSVAGDANATRIFQQFETYQQQIDAGNEQGVRSALEFEREILKTVRDNFQFFDQQQFLDLTRLREDRHRCAHPSFQRIEEPYRPSAELARLHLRNAICHVLEQLPVQGRSALNELKVLITSQYFPKEVDKAVKQLSASSFGRPSESLINGFVDLLTFGFFDQASGLRFSKNVVPALKAAIELHRGQVLPRFGRQLNKVIRDVVDADLIGAAYLALKICEVLPIIEQQAKDKLAQFIVDGPTKDVVAILADAVQVPELRAAAQTRINNMDLTELTEAISRYQLGKPAVSRAVELFSSAYNWNNANTIASSVVLPILNFFEKADVLAVVKSPTERRADLLGSIGFAQFLDKVVELGIVTQEELDQMLIENDLSYLAKKQRPEE